jgi:MFS family permease
MIFFALFLPAFVLAPLAGVAADRFDRKRIVVACYATVVAIALSLAYLTHAGRVTTAWLLGLSFLLGTCFSFSGPANMAIAANSVPKADLSSAVSLQSAINNLTRVVGPMLAGPLVATGRFDVAFALYAAAAATAGCSSRASACLRGAATRSSGLRRSRRFAHARERRPALPALRMVAVLSLFGVSHVTLLSVFANDRLGDIRWFAWIVAATARRARGRARRRTRRASVQPPLRMAVYGALLAAFALTERPWLAMAAQVWIGYFYFAVMTELQTLLQELVDEPLRGRVMSLFQVAWAGLIPFGSLGMGAAAAAIGVTATLRPRGRRLRAYGFAMALRPPR